MHSVLLMSIVESRYKLRFAITCVNVFFLIEVQSYELKLRLIHLQLTF